MPLLESSRGRKFRDEALNFIGRKKMLLAVRLVGLSAHPTRRKPRAAGRSFKLLRQRLESSILYARCVSLNDSFILNYMYVHVLHFATQKMRTNVHM